MTIGSAMNRSDSIERILAGFDELEGVETGDFNARRWTKEIKTKLCEVGNGLGHYTCASNVGEIANHGEWLFDVCWLEWNGDLYSVPMVAECEWGDGHHIRDDFQKLLVARADIRLLVCDAGWFGMEEEAKATAQQICGWVHAFNGTRLGDVYLLVAYEREKISKPWRSYRYQISVSDEGGPPTVRLL